MRMRNVALGYMASRPLGTAGNLLRRSVIGALCGLPLLGCAPSTDEVCAHVATIDPKLGDTACQLKFGWLKETKPATYRKVAPCVMAAKDFATYNDCLPPAE